MEQDDIQEIIEIIKETLEKDKEVKICHKFQAPWLQYFNSRLSVVAIQTEGCIFIKMQPSFNYIFPSEKCYSLVNDICYYTHERIKSAWL